MDDIKILIDRWYEGETSPSEELRIQEFFASHPVGSLSADLESERPIFEGIAGINSEIIPMPEEYASRIEGVLEKEMQSDSVAEGMISQKPKSVWRRRLLAAGTVACCLLAAVVTIRTAITIPGTDLSPDTLAYVGSHVAGNPVVVTPTQIADTMAAMSLEAEPILTADEARHRSAKPANVAKAHRQIERSYGSVEETQVHDEMAYSSPIMDEQMAASAGYRVVENEAEAHAIINSTWSRIETKMVQESYRIQELEVNCEMQVAKLYN